MEKFKALFVTLKTIYHRIGGLVGFILFSAAIMQIYTGYILISGYVPEPSLAPKSREEEADGSVRFVNKELYLHEIGVQVLMVVTLYHVLVKMWNRAHINESEIAWKIGVVLYLSVIAATFFGLVLTANHLSEVTLTIAGEGLGSFTCQFIDPWVLVFGENNQPSLDCLCRIYYFHIICGVLFFIIALGHGVHIHGDFKIDTYSKNGLKVEVIWFDEVYLREVWFSIKFLTAVYIYLIYLAGVTGDTACLDFDFFSWGDMVVCQDIAYGKVSPHWYFRIFMNWLIITPIYRPGLAGIVLIFSLLYLQPNIHHPKGSIFQWKASVTRSLVNRGYWINLSSYKSIKDVNSQVTVDNSEDFGYHMRYGYFLMSIHYVVSFLVCGKFWSQTGDHHFVLAYYYIILYLWSTNFQKSTFAKGALKTALKMWILKKIKNLWKNLKMCLNFFINYIIDVLKKIYNKISNLWK